MSKNKPTYSALNTNFPKLPADKVTQLIGGKVEDNDFKNACALRISRALNYSGINIPYLKNNQTVSGNDHKWYIYRVDAMKTYLETIFGKPDLISSSEPYEKTFAGKKGIILFEVNGWSDATGHVTLWNGHTCMYNDDCYFNRSRQVMLWILKD